MSGIMSYLSPAAPTANEAAPSPSNGGNLFANGQARPQRQATRRRQGGLWSEGKEPSKHWLNFGVADGDQFYAVAGIPLDHLEFFDLNGQSQESVDFKDRVNQVIEALMMACGTLPNGGTTVLPEGALQFQIRKVGQALAPTGTEDRAKQVSNLAMRMLGKAANTQAPAPQQEAAE